jgi:hypothetical protein
MCLTRLHCEHGPPLMSAKLALLLFTSTSVLACAGAASPPSTAAPPAPSSKTVLDLADVVANPPRYEWFEFRPNVKKLILAGAPETEHVAILWYTVAKGSVGLHRHSKTESVYVIDGAQTDGKGVYAQGTAYFNPPGSGHAIQDSAGFFLLAYAAPPDFQNTAAIAEYSPVRIDTTDVNLMQAATPERSGAAARTLRIPLDPTGGMSGLLLELPAASERYDYSGNYLLVLRGRCEVSGVPLAERGLMVSKTVEPEPFAVAAAAGSSCTAMGVSF